MRLFVLTPEARNDLKEIFLDVAEDSPETAQRLRLEFYEGLQALGRCPGIGHYNVSFRQACVTKDGPGS